MRQHLLPTNSRNSINGEIGSTGLRWKSSADFRDWASFRPSAAGSCDSRPTASKSEGFLNSCQACRARPRKSRVESIIFHAMLRTTPVVQSAPTLQFDRSVLRQRCQCRKATSLRTWEQTSFHCPYSEEARMLTALLTAASRLCTAQAIELSCAISTPLLHWTVHH